MSDVLSRIRGQLSRPYIRSNERPEIVAIMSEAADRIEALVEQVTDERTRTERYKRHRDKAEAQAAAMRKALEEKLLDKLEDGVWHCECGVWHMDRGHIDHTPDCPLSSDAGKPILAVLEAVEDVDVDLRPVLNNPEFERAGNVIAMRLQPLLKLHETFAALKEVKDNDRH